MDTDFLLQLNLGGSLCALAVLLALRCSDMVEKEIGQFAAKQVNASFVTHLPVSDVSSPLVFTCTYVLRQSPW